MINNNSWVSHSHVVILRLLFLGEKDMENVGFWIDLRNGKTRLPEGNLFEGEQEPTTTQWHKSGTISSRTLTSVYNNQISIESMYIGLLVKLLLILFSWRALIVQNN